MALAKVVLCILIQQISASLQSIAFVSDQTNPSMKGYLSSTASNIENNASTTYVVKFTVATITSCSDVTTWASTVPEIDMVFDATSSGELGWCIITNFAYNSITTFQVDLDQEHVIHPYVLNLFPSRVTEAKAMHKVVENFQWELSVVITGEDFHSLQVSQELQQLYTPILVASTWNDCSYDIVRNFVARQLKTRGTRISVILLEAASAKNILIAADEKHIGGAGYGFLLSQQSSWYSVSGTDEEALLKTGVIILEETGLESANNYYELVGLSITRALTEAASSYISTESVYTNTRASYDADGYRIGTYTLSNINNGTRSTVGSVTSSTISVTGTITFPGGTTDTPQNAAAAMQISYLYVNFESFSIAADVGITHVNGSNTILPNHEYTMFKFETLPFYSTVDDYIARYSENQDQLGLMLMDGWSSSSSIKANNAITQMGIQMPILGGACTSPTLSSTEDYPLFQRMIQSDIFGATILAEFIDNLGWKNVALIYHTDTWAWTYGEKIAEELVGRGINIVNDIDLRVIDTADPSEVTDAVISPIVTPIWNSKVRMVIALLPWGYGPIFDTILQKFSDLGAVPGDILFMVNAMLTGSFVNPLVDNLGFEVASLFKGSLEFVQSTYLGELGQLVKQDMIDLVGDANTWGAFLYDGVLAGALTIDWMLAQGLEFEDQPTYRYGFRLTRVTGATGQITYQKDTNDRDVGAYDINNLQEADGALSSVLAGIYNPLAQTIFTYYGDGIIYGDGTTAIPTEFRTDTSDCPFAEEDRQDSTIGSTIVYMAGIGFITLTLVLTLVIWRKHKKAKIPPLNNRQVISQADIILLVVVLFEFFQYNAMGPDFRSMSTFLHDLSSATRVDVEQFTSISEGGFWYMLMGCMFVVAIWAFCVLMFLTRMVANDSCWCYYLGAASDVLLPFIGNAMFLPIIYIHYEVFICTESIGDEATDSFMNIDCHEFCWKDEHLLYAVASIISLTLYLPCAIYTRPFWQYLQHDLHIWTMPQFLILKSCIQVLLIVTAKILREDWPKTHAFIFIALMTLYIVINFKIRAFNYGRVWFWHVLSLFGTLWLGLITCLDMVTDDHYAYVIILFWGWASIIIGGAVAQRRFFPSYLYLAKHPNLMGLYAWAFRPTGTVQAERAWFRSQTIYNKVDKGDAANSISVHKGKHHALSSDSRTNFDGRTNYKMDPSFDSQSNQPMSSDYQRHLYDGDSNNDRTVAVIHNEQIPKATINHQLRDQYEGIQPNFEVYQLSKDLDSRFSHQYPEQQY